MSIEFDIKRRRRVVRASVRPGTATIGTANGEWDAGPGKLWVRRRTGGRDANGNALFGNPFPVWAGDTNYDPGPGREVYIGPGKNTELTILGPVPADLVAAGIDSRALNPNDPYRQYGYTTNLVPFRSDPLAAAGDDRLDVNLNQLLYKDAYGNWYLWEGTDDPGIDSAALKPVTTDEHCLFIVALRTLENTYQIVASTPKDAFTPLELTDLQEAADKLDPEVIDSRCYRLSWDMDTLVADPATDWDLRQWINVPARFGNPTVISKKLRIRDDHQVLYHGTVEIVTGGDLEILGELVVIDDVVPVVVNTGGGGGTTDDSARFLAWRGFR